MKKPKKEKLKKINWFSLILILLILGLLIYLLVSIFTPNASEISMTQFADQWTEASIDPNDNTYFSYFFLNPYQSSIEYVFVNKGVSNSYIVGLNRDAFDKINSLFFAPTPDGQWIPQITPEINAISFKGDAKIYLNFRNAINYPTPWYVTFFYSFGPLIIICLVMFLVYRAQMKNAGGGVFSPGKNQAQKIISDKKFSDIAGNEEVKEEVMELVDYLKNPKKYDAAGARIPKGILLGGPPGTGKTLIAKATAGEANVPFYFISASNFVEMFVGVGAKRVRELFKDARKEAPAIIFIDELDAVGRSRGAGLGGGNDEREQTLNQLLVEMDGMTDNSGILVIAATNRTDVLDPALLRPGRFDRTITVNLPDIKEREAILRLHAKGKRIDPNITFESLAKRTPGYSGAQLENVINEAALLSVRERTSIITKEQIDEAIDRVMSGPAKKTRTITKEELEMVAYHEAGHAVVGLKVPGGNKVQKITIIPRGQAGGYNLMLPEKEKYNQTKLELEAMIKSYMGGRAAEEIIYGKENISTGASDDIQRATSIARRMVTEWGMSSLGPIQYEEPEGSVFLGRDYTKTKVLSDAVGQEIDVEIRKIIQSALDSAREIIKNNLKLLDLIKTSLLKNETIVAEEIEYINKYMKLPNEKEDEKLVKKQENLDLKEILNQFNSPDSQKQIDNELNSMDIKLKDNNDSKDEKEDKNN